MNPTRPAPRQDAPYNRINTEPISRSFEIAQSENKSSGPFFVYKFSVSKSENLAGDGAHLVTEKKEGRVRARIRRLALNKALEEWLSEHKPKRDAYLVSSRLVYTLFTFTDLERIKAATKEGHSYEPADSFKKQVTVQDERYMESGFTLVDERYDVHLSLTEPPVQDVTKEAMNGLVFSTIKSFLLADIEENEAFARGQGAERQVFKLGDKEHRRITRVGPYLIACRGLALNISQDTKFFTTLRLTESTGLFFESVNVIDLLRDYFKFDVNTPLSPNQISDIRRELSFQAVEMRPFCLDDGHDDKDLRSTYRVTLIRDVGTKSIDEELYDFIDEDEGRQIEGTTVAQEFMRKFPSVELQYKHLPCLISPIGRKMPMEVCWLKQQVRLNRPMTEQEKHDKRRTYHERLEIFDENCDEFVRHHCSTLEKFGYKLIPVQV